MPLIIPPDALRQLAKVPKVDRKRLVDALQQVADRPDFRFSFITELQGESGVWRLRKGDWRAVYRIVSGDVVVDRVGHRREIY